MTRHNANAQLQGKRVRYVHAHPDDSVVDAQLYGHDSDEALVTLGDKGGDPELRLKEEQRAAAVLGFKRVLVYPGRDQHVREDLDTLAGLVAYDAARDGIDIFVTTHFTDHDDHEAVTELTLEAARRMASAGHAVGVLLIHHSNEGAYTTEATQESVTRAFHAGLQHQSQWGMRAGIHEDWPIRGGVSVPHDTLTVLENLYPITRDASYTWLPAEHFIAKQAELLASAPR